MDGFNNNLALLDGRYVWLQPLDGAVNYDFPIPVPGMDAMPPLDLNFFPAADEEEEMVNYGVIVEDEEEEMVNNVVIVENEEEIMNYGVIMEDEEEMVNYGVVVEDEEEEIVNYGVVMEDEEVIVNYGVMEDEGEIVNYGVIMEMEDEEEDARSEPDHMDELVVDPPWIEQPIEAYFGMGLHEVGQYAEIQELVRSEVERQMEAFRLGLREMVRSEVERLQLEAFLMGLDEAYRWWYAAHFHPPVGEFIQDVVYTAEVGGRDDGDMDLELRL